jgi:hypothetical protein
MNCTPAVIFTRDGTTHIVDLTVPIPKTISFEAQAMLEAKASTAQSLNEHTQTVAKLRAAYAA